MNIRIEKRVPFGFKGEWGKVYKLYVYDEITEQNVIKWQGNSYADIGQDVQFKYIENGVDKQIHISQPVMNLLKVGEYRVAKTTDACFDPVSGNFECVVGLGDIVFVFGRYWVVDKIEEQSIFTPAKQTFYYLGLKDVYKELLQENA